MGFLTNLRLRRKLLIAMVPLALMVVVAGVYSSVESKMIDTWYSVLIDNSGQSAQKRWGGASDIPIGSGCFFLNWLIETDPDRRQVIDGELDTVGADFHAAMTAALKQSPERADKINAASALFEQAEADARPVRAAALAGDNAKALHLLRGGVNQELQQARQATIEIMQDFAKIY